MDWYYQGLYQGHPQAHTRWVDNRNRRTHVPYYKDQEDPYDPVESIHRRYGYSVHLPPLDASRGRQTDPGGRFSDDELERLVDDYVEPTARQRSRKDYAFRPWNVPRLVEEYMYLTDKEQAEHYPQWMMYARKQNPRRNDYETSSEVMAEDRHSPRRRGVTFRGRTSRQDASPEPPRRSSEPGDIRRVPFPPPRERERAVVYTNDISVRRPALRTDFRHRMRGREELLAEDPDEDRAILVAASGDGQDDIYNRSLAFRQRAGKVWNQGEHCLYSYNLPKDRYEKYNG